MQCTIEIDERLLRKAQLALGTQTVEETVNAGLLRVVSLPDGTATTPSDGSIDRGAREALALSAGIWADRSDLGATADYVSQLRAEWDRS